MAYAFEQQHLSSVDPYAGGSRYGGSMGLYGELVEAERNRDFNMVDRATPNYTFDNKRTLSHYRPELAANYKPEPAPAPVVAAAPTVAAAPAPVAPARGKIEGFSSCGMMPIDIFLALYLILVLVLMGFAVRGIFKVAKIMEKQLEAVQK